MTDGGSPVRRAARSVTAPVRDYLNDHFEMVKQEIRDVAAARPRSTDGSGDAWNRVAELEAQLAEQALHQARLLARIGDDVAELSARVHDLERVVRQLAAVVAAPDTV